MDAINIYMSNKNRIEHRIRKLLVLQNTSSNPSPFEFRNLNFQIIFDC